nr:G protein-coupled receptor [Proales similis]
MKFKFSFLLIFMLDFSPVELLANFTSVRCYSRWNDLPNKCLIHTECRLDTAEQARNVFLIEPKFQIKCCHVKDIQLKLYLYYATGLSLSGDQASGAFLKLKSEECARRLSEVEIHYVGSAGIHFKFSAYESKATIIQHWLEFGRLRPIYGNGSRASCSSLNAASLFKGQRARASLLNFHDGVAYDSDTCDTMFHKTKLNALIFKRNINSLVKRNQIGFRRTMNASELKSRILMVEVEGYGYSWNRKSFSASVFAQTRSIFLKGAIETFEPETLINKQLEKLHLEILGLERFFHNNVAWLDCANRRTVNSTTLQVDLPDPNPEPTGVPIGYIDDSTSHRIIEQFNTLYDLEPKDVKLFDPENFCLFYRVEQKSLNVRFTGSLIERQGRVECSCTLFWLWQKFFDAQDESLMTNYDSMASCENKSSELMRQCEFEQMAARCLLEPVLPIKEPSSYTQVIKLKVAEFWASVLFGPAFSLVAVLVNVLVLLVLISEKRSASYRKNKLQDKNRRMWRYVYINSWFTLFQALIFVSAPLTSCIEYGGVYCSPLILTRFAQYYYLVVESYLGNVFRLMTNLTNTMFVLYRYAVNLECWSTFRAWRPSRLLFAALIPCLLISLIKFKLNERFGVDVLFFSPDQYFTINNLQVFEESQLLKALYLSNMLLCNMVFVAINLLIDIRLLLHLRGRNQKNRKEEVESRITKMIILNGFFSFLFRSPEIASNLLLLIYSFNVEFFTPCVLVGDPIHSACPILFRIAKLFYTISLSENFLLLVLFNRQFRDRFYSMNSCFCSSVKSEETHATN